MTWRVEQGRGPLSIHVVWLFIVGFLLVLHAIMPPSICMFKNVTGIPCLTCGASRAAEALLAGDFLGMLYLNPLLVLFCLGLCFFSLFKFAEFIFRFKLIVKPGKAFFRAARMICLFMLATNWLFLIVTGR